MTDTLRDAVRAGHPLTGTVLTLPGVTSAELIAEAFDVVWIDLEHGALGAREAQEMVIGSQAAGAFALARLPADAHALMTAVLDAGADGVVLADVDDASVAAAAVDRVLHPPAGNRGWGPRRLTLRHRSAHRTPARPSVWVQIESARGVERARDIAGVEGIDAIVVGTADLSFSVGTPLDTHAPQLVDAVGHVAAAARQAGTAFGVAGALDAAPPELYADATILVHATDARLCAAAVDEAARWLRTVIRPSQRGMT
jgi:2-keto-3-deoxy-L-rhamnonate aldolase RhmA